MKNFFYIISFSFLFSCNGYQKIVKSNDVDLKYLMAKSFYEDEEYFKALPLLDELHTLFKGTNKAEEIDYLLAYTHYGLGSNMLASYYFKIFTVNYPYSKYTEELSFMAAYCYYLESPKYSLDKTNTIKAIKELQAFIDKYPKSEKAPINLLKLGVSLVQIGEKDQGCLMIAGVKKQYPNATQSVLQKAKYEEKKFECNKEKS